MYDIRETSTYRKPKNLEGTDHVFLVVQTILERIVPKSHATMARLAQETKQAQSPKRCPCIPELAAQAHRMLRIAPPETTMCVYPRQPMVGRRRCNLDVAERCPSHLQLTLHCIRRLPIVDALDFEVASRRNCLDSESFDLRRTNGQVNRAAGRSSTPKLSAVSAQRSVLSTQHQGRDHPLYEVTMADVQMWVAKVLKSCTFMEYHHRHTLPRPLSPTRKDVKLNKYSSQLTQDKVCGVTWACVLVVSSDVPCR